MQAGFYELLDEYERRIKAGELTDALETAGRLWDRVPERRDYTWLCLVEAHAAMGDLQQAASDLRRALDANVLWRLSLLDAPGLEIVRSDPACQSVIHEARRRIEAEGYRALVITAMPLGEAVAPLLLHLHGANRDAAVEIPYWRGATELGWIVAAGQSSQPTAKGRFCWDPPAERRAQDIREIAGALPPHTGLVMSGFSQGAWVALQAALRADILQPDGVIMVAPFLPGRERLEPSRGRLRIVMILGELDPIIQNPDAVIEELEARGHEVEVLRIPGLGHSYPADFAGRLPHLLESVARPTRD